jgi:hypothetical protein
VRATPAVPGRKSLPASLTYSCFALGYTLDPQHFDMNDRHLVRNINVETTGKALKRHFPNYSLGEVILTVSPKRNEEANQWYELRNMLTHRIAPQRRVVIKVQEGIISDTWSDLDIPLTPAVLEESSHGFNCNSAMYLSLRGTSARRRLRDPRMSASEILTCPRCEGKEAARCGP